MLVSIHQSTHIHRKFNSSKLECFTKKKNSKKKYNGYAAFFERKTYV